LSLKRERGFACLSDLLVREDHGGEGLVYFVEVNVVGGDASHLEGPGDGLGGGGGKLLGVMGGISKAPDEREGLEVKRGGLLGTHENQRAGTVVELGGVCGGDRADFLEGGLEGGDLVELDALVLLVLRDNRVRSAPSSWNRDGHDLSCEEASLFLVVVVLVLMSIVLGRKEKKEKEKKKEKTLTAAADFW